MKDYFYNIFPTELSRLKFTPANAVELQIHNDPSLMFFGGQNWKNASSDLANIPYDERPLFVLSLFMITITDQCLYTHFHEAYDAWRRKTNFPKFGWSGFGLHNENPFLILSVAEQQNLIDTEETKKLIPQFTAFFVEECARFFSENNLNIKVHDFLTKITHDEAYNFSDGDLVKSVKDEINAQVNC